MIRKEILPFLLLLVAMLLVSFNAVAHEVKSGTAQDSCACHPVDHAPVDKNGEPEHDPDSHGGGCFGCEECCPDLTDPSVFTGLRVTVAVNQLVQPCPDSFVPAVYLAIFVPPESSSLS
jgi:hypothetical protein